MSEQQTAASDWLAQEAAQATTTNFGEKLPSLKLQENVVTEISIDISAPFGKWTNEDGTTKAIIPVTVAGVKHNFWLNIKNPLYKDLIQSCRAGQTTIKLIQTGNLKNTRYSIVK